MLRMVICSCGFESFAKAACNEIIRFFWSVLELSSTQSEYRVLTHVASIVDLYAYLTVHLLTCSERRLGNANMFVDTSIALKCWI